MPEIRPDTVEEEMEAMMELAAALASSLLARAPGGTQATAREMVAANKGGFMMIP